MGKIDFGYAGLMLFAFTLLATSISFVIRAKDNMHQVKGEIKLIEQQIKTMEKKVRLSEVQSAIMTDTGRIKALADKHFKASFARPEQVRVVHGLGS